MHLHGTFAPLIALENQVTEIDALINNFNTAVTETANNIFGKHRPAKKPCVTDNILKLCDKRRELKQEKNTTEGAKLYREANQLKQARGKQRRQGLKNNAKVSGKKPAEKQQQESLPAVKELTSSKQRRTTTIQGKAEKCLTEE